MLKYSTSDTWDIDILGDTVGETEGGVVEETVGETVGDLERGIVGEIVGCWLFVTVGSEDRRLSLEGADKGLKLGEETVDIALGIADGDTVGNKTLSVGDCVIVIVGEREGTGVGLSEAANTGKSSSAILYMW